MEPEISYGHFGEITPDEREEMMLTRQLGAVAPSPTDQAYMRRLDMGQRNVREQIDSGQIPPDVGQSILGRMQERAAPLMLRAEQVPIYMARLNAIRMQRQMAQQEAMFAQNMAFRARTLESRMHTFDDGENGHFTLVETPDGRPIIVNGRPRRGPAGSGATAPWEDRQAAAVAREGRDFARRQFNDWRRNFVETNARAPNPEETSAFMENLEATTQEFNRRFGPPPSQLSASGGAAAAIGGAGPAAEAARPGTAPRPFGGVTPPSATRPEPWLPGATIAVPELEALRPALEQRVAAGLAGSGVMAAVNRITELDRRGRLTQAEQREVLGLIDELRALSRRPIPTSRPPVIRVPERPAPVQYGAGGFGAPPPPMSR